METNFLDDAKGAFVNSLRRNNKKIREDRAAAIAEDAQTLYRRTVEDLVRSIRKLQMDRNSLLDLSATDTTSLMVATDFKSDEFVAKDISMGVEIRQLEIKLDVAKKRYEYLFEDGVLAPEKPELNEEAKA
jgi:hypothetical protein